MSAVKSSDERNYRSGDIAYNIAEQGQRSAEHSNARICNED